MIAVDERTQALHLAYVHTSDSHLKSATRKGVANGRKQRTNVMQRELSFPIGQAFGGSWHVAAQRVAPVLIMSHALEVPSANALIVNGIDHRAWALASRDSTPRQHNRPSPAMQPYRHVHGMRAATELRLQRPLRSSRGVCPGMPGWLADVEHSNSDKTQWEWRVSKLLMVSSLPTSKIP